MGISKSESKSLKHEDALRNPSSPKYNHLLEVVHDAIDRMVMQSDLRDIYHGIHLAGFSTIPVNSTTPAVDSSNDGHGINAKFQLMLSDNTKTEQNLTNVFKEYLHENNYNLGGTNVYSTPLLAERIQAYGECFNKGHRILFYILIKTFFPLTNRFRRMFEPTTS